MNSFKSGSRGKNAGAPVKLAAAALCVLACAMPLARAQQFPSNPGWNNVDLAGYRQHLQALDGVVAACQAQLNLKSTPPANQNACDPNRVGPNDHVQWLGSSLSQPREVRYDWLRSVLSQAENPGAGTPAVVLGAQTGAKKPSSSVGDLLNEARQRLAADEQQAGSPLTANPNYTDQRNSLDAILAQKQYKSVTRVSVRDRILEWLGNQLDKILGRLAGMGARAPWVGRLLQLLLLAAALTVLVWFLVRMERNARVRLVPDVESAPGAPSVREWQLWLKDAQSAAATGQWRDAIHSVYWASIARLESGRLWPADRARTPREYLALVEGTDPRKPTLTALTRSFERTWYGGREAAAADFDDAMKLASDLGVAAG